MLSDWLTKKSVETNVEETRLSLKKSGRWSLIIIYCVKAILGENIFSSSSFLFILQTFLYWGLMQMSGYSLVF